MVRVITTGDNQYADTLGGTWYSGVSITCPRCACVFRLDNADFEVAGPFMDFDLGQHLHWDKLNSVYGVISANTWWPDAVQGACPWCNYYPILVIGPAFGTVHPAAPSSAPSVGTIQDLYVNHAVREATFRTRNADGALIGVFLLADGSPYYAGDSTQQTARAVMRVSGVVRANITYTLATPSFPIVPSAARYIDADLCVQLDDAGIVII